MADNNILAQYLQRKGGGFGNPAVPFNQLPQATQQGVNDQYPVDPRMQEQLMEMYAPFGQQPMTRPVPQPGQPPAQWLPWPGNLPADAPPQHIQRFEDGLRYRAPPPSAPPPPTKPEEALY